MIEHRGQREQNDQEQDGRDEHGAVLVARPRSARVPASLTDPDQFPAFYFPNVWKYARERRVPASKSGSRAQCIFFSATPLLTNCSV